MFFQTIITDIMGFVADILLYWVDLAGLDTLKDHLTTLIEYIASLNSLVPLASLSAICITTFGIRMTIRIVRLLLGLIPTVHG